VRPLILASVGTAAVIVAAGAYFELRDRNAPDASQALVQLQSAARSYGEPGDSARTARTVEIGIRELHDGRMYFYPDVVTVRPGEQIRFVVANNGEFGHEFVLGSTRDNLLRVEARKRNEGPGNDPASVQVGSTERGELLWRFPKAGEFEIADPLPGYRQAGLVGRIVVK
jgi:uncharacterized cupredoxin-like copper-binding protein